MAISPEERRFSQIPLVEQLKGDQVARAYTEALLHFEHRQRVLAAAEGWIWDEDPVHHHPGAEISIANAFYGKPLNSPEEIIAETREIMARLGKTDVADYTNQTGFPRLRQLTPGLTNQEYLLSQELVAHELISAALDTQNIRPEDVDLFIATTSIPIAPHYDLAWATAAGIPPTVPMIRISEACNSSGHAIARVLSGDFDKLIAKYNPQFSGGIPANIVLMALDDANRLADRGGDPLSPQFFSTGAAAMVWKYHPESPSSLKKIVHRSMSEERGTEYLLVPRPYDEWDESEKENLYTAQYLKSPAHPGPIDMDPRASGAFVTYATRLAEEVMTEYGEQGGSISDIARVIVHHPSKAVFDGLVKRLIRKGFSEEQINWVIDEGNVPVATIPIAFGRQLDSLKAGARVLFLSFGAGGEYTCFIADMGGVPPASTLLGAMSSSI